MDYPCYIIHTKEGAEDRELSIIKQFARLKMPFEWILDYDIINLDQSALDRYGYYGNKLSPAEISCSLKHITAWERIAAGDSQGAFVFEDDVLISVGRFKQVVRQAIEEFYACVRDIGHISLGDGDAMYVPWTKTRKNRRLYPAEQVRMADSYWITRQTARIRLAYLAKYGFYLPADHLINKIDNEQGIPIFWLEPTVVTQGSHTGRFTSQLQAGDGGRLKKKIKWMAKRLRRQYLYPLLGRDPRPLESSLRADLGLSQYSKRGNINATKI